MNDQFLQSLEWEKFQKSLNRKTWRVEDKLVIKHDLFFNKSYLYCPRGEVSINFLKEVEKIAKQENVIFLKIEPVVNFQSSSFNFKKSDKQIQPAKTIVLDISKTKDELLDQMHKKTRYNIRLAQKKGIVIEKSDKQESLDIFIKLLKKTAQRDKFHLHPKEYYQKMIDALGQDMTELFLAKYKNKVIAANLVIFYNNTATYLHGASDYEYRQLMAPYLLQWKIILEAKQRNLQLYDFWGIDEDKWPGVTRFKKGFNGNEISYPGAYDLVYNKSWYWIYKISRKIL